MTILVCPLSKLATLVAARAPERIVSLLDPDFTFPETGRAYVGKHLRLRFHDAHVATAGMSAGPRSATTKTACVRIRDACGDLVGPRFGWSTTLLEELQPEAQL